MEKNIILRLCEVIWSRNNEIRAIMGMCHEHYKLRTHQLFIEKRPLNLPLSFRTNPMGGCKIDTCLKKIRCIFVEKNAFRTIFLDECFSAGILRWEIHIKYNLEYSRFNLGGVPPAVIWSPDCVPMARIRDSCGLDFTQEYSEEKHKFVRGLSMFSHIQIVNLTMEYAVRDDSSVALEIDFIKSTISYFIDSEKVPYAISGVQAPLRLGVSGYFGTSFTSLSFRRLPTPTPSSAQCTYISYC